MHKVGVAAAHAHLRRVRASAALSHAASLSRYAHFHAIVHAGYYLLRRRDRLEARERGAQTRLRRGALRQRQAGRLFRRRLIR